MRRSVFFLILVNALVLGGVGIAHAQGFVPLSPAPEGTKLAGLYGSASLADFINRLFTISISVGAILAVLRLAFAGYMYMTSDAFGHKSHAKEVIGDVVLGLLLLLSIWLILRQINPDILNLDILRNTTPVNPAQFTVPSSGGGGDPTIQGCGVGGCDQSGVNPGGF